jgi:spore coat protein U-like protein
MKKELNKTKGVFVKKTKMSLAKSTTALTCLIGSLIIVSSEPGMGVTTTSGSMEVSGSVSSVCTISAGAMAFDAYSGSEVVQFSRITANCTNGTTYTISLNDAPVPGTSTYNLIRNGVTGGDADLATNQLGVIFKSGSTTLTNAVSALTGTGTGTIATAGTLTGTIAASQTGKTAGTYSKTMTLNIVY